MIKANSKKPKHCIGCLSYHKAGHPKGSNLRGGKHDNWCCKYSTSAPKAVSICLLQNGKRTE